ncbi:MAG TPA: tetratricopeptide repeat protein, partial [Tepidisphaeraceae bacterium]|nr:tetratricopeptide repeat protein [Tepidisphaeraceae bacterium]
MPDDNRLARAIALFDAGRLQECESLLREQLQANPAHPSAMHLLGLICSKTGRIVEGIDLLVRSVTFSPNDAGYRRNLGGALRLAGRPAEACDCYGASLALRNDPDVLIDLSSAQLESGNAKEAEKNARQALQAGAKRFDASMALGSALFSMHRFDQALGAFQEAVKVDSNSAQAYQRLGTTLYHLGRVGKACEI